MNVVESLLKPKFPEGTEFNAKEWEDKVHRLVEAFIRKRGMHQDERDNFNSYLPEILTMLKDHVKPSFIDEQGQLHQIEILEAHFVLPHETTVGIDSVERALLRGNYECEVRGITRYSIRRKPSEGEKIEKIEKIEKTNESEEKEEKEDDTEEEEEVEEEEENDNDASSEESEKEEEEEEEEEEEDHEEKEETEEDEDEEEEEDEKTRHKKARLASKQVELKPVVGLSRNITKECKEDQAFLIEKEDYSKYSEVVSEVIDEHMCMEMPVWLQSKLCWMSTPYREPFLQTKPYLMGQTYLVSRTFKLCPYEEYYLNNRILSMKDNCVEIRSKFYHRSKRFRTNCTLKFLLNYPKSRHKNRSWWCPPRFVMEIPHEKPKLYCSITVLAMAYGWTPVVFVDAVRMFLRYKTTSYTNALLHSILMDTDECRSQADAIRRVSTFLSKCRRMAVAKEIASYVSFTLRGEFLPNLVDMEGDDTCNHTLENLRKGYMLAEVCAELVQLTTGSDEWKPVDRRAYHIKRIDTPGEKIVFLTRKFVRHLVKKAAKGLETVVTQGKSIDMCNILNPKIIKLTNAVKNGVYDSKSDASENNQNKTQMAITGYCSDALRSQVQKIIKFAMKKNSNPEPLLTHPTQMGRVDLYLTPESERCAIVRNKALGCWLTPLTDHINMNHMILRCIRANREKIGWKELERRAEFPDKSWTAIKDIYGGLIGWSSNVFELYRLFAGLRRRCAIWPFLGMEWDRQRDVFYFTIDEGRMCRPLIILEKFKELLLLMDGPGFMYNADPIQYLMEHGVIEYLDAAEEYCGLVFTAESLDDTIKGGFLHTHMEVHGLFSMSIMVAKAFCNFNAGPRRMYTGNMEKRSISLKLFEDRGTTVSYSLWYAQDALISNIIDYSLGARHQEPNGFNVFVGVLSDRDNIEDSYVMNEDSVQRGLGISSETMIVTTSLGSNCAFQRPDIKTKGKAPEDKYHAIGLDGTPKERSHLRGGDAIVAKTFFRKDKTEVAKRCVSKFLPMNEEYTVRTVSKYPNDVTKPTRIVRVSLIKTNVPTAGDKFFFGHGQKGTISSLRRHWDLPFVESGPMAGRSPDILINVCAFARVTLGFQLELLWSKARAYDAARIHQYRSTFLSDMSFEEQTKMCSAILRLNGLSHTGKERLRSGETGRVLKCMVYVGFANMRVLKHMARDKLRSRDRGPINEHTRQPTVGKKMHGSLRAISGEHENINTYSYGMSAVFRAVNYECADKFTTYYCNKCHMQAVGCKDSKLYFCISCKSSQHVLRVPMTYITNLVFSELYAAGIGHTIMTEKIPEDEIVQDDDAIFDQFQQLRVKSY